MKKPYAVYVLLLVAAICNAVMDTSQHHKGGRLCALSASPQMQQWFNCMGDSWLNKYADRQPARGEKTIHALGVELPYTVQLTDSFHFFKMLMIMALSAIVALALTPVKQITRSQTINFMIHWLAAGLIWCAGFNLFYSYLLK